jgi:isoleucyl-tRNA synthetase
MDEKQLKQTLNLPQTKFPMKANLVQREPDFVKDWDQVNIFGKLRETKKGKPSFVFHDGPPYANGKIHLGHVINKVLKDLAVKSRSMMGYDCAFIPGWDCHGLPIELQVEKTTGAKMKTMERVQFRQECRKYAEKYIDIQRQSFKRLGVFGDWDHPYTTMSYSYEATIARSLGKFFGDGLVYRGFKPVHWCWSCETALADTEVEYLDHKSPSVYVKFPVVEDWSSLDPALAGKKIFVVIWTTTPWTLPANLAIAFHPEQAYVAYEVLGGETYILAEKMLAAVIQAAALPEGKVLATVPGARFEKRKARHPFIDRDSLLILADYVTMDQGTGAVHTAPGHGSDDYYSGVKYGLEILTPVDGKGRFYPEVEHFGGQFTLKANPAIVEHLRSSGMLLHAETLAHTYPHCPRCHNPILFRATEQWFISLEKLRAKALEEIKRVRWLPAWGEERMYNMIESRPDWTISRQRVWGVPITAFRCKNGHGKWDDARIFEFVADIYEKEGADAWYIRDAKDLMPPGVVCNHPECGATEFEKLYDILDVWFDSGVSHESVLGGKDRVWAPADLYLEGNDQYRGWFNSSLMTAVKLHERAPYRTVVTHGMVVDAEGRKMSKSLGNVIDPEDVMKTMGAEILRSWVSMVDYREEIRIGKEILSRVSEAYRKIRNTFRYLLSNLYDFDPDKNAAADDQLEPIDRWAMQELSDLSRRVVEAYDRYEYHVVYHSIYRFCSVEMSAFYLDISKDRMYVSHPDGRRRRSAQTAMFRILNALVRLVAPIFSFTAEEVWREVPAFQGKESSVHLSEFQEQRSGWLTDQEKEDWARLALYREEVLKLMEASRQRKEIGSSLESTVVFYYKKEEEGTIRRFESFLPELFIASAVELREGDAVRFEIRVADGKKCQRCWQIKPDVGSIEACANVCRRCCAVLDELAVGKV